MQEGFKADSLHILISLWTHTTVVMKIRWWSWGENDWAELVPYIFPTGLNRSVWKSLFVNQASFKVSEAWLGGRFLLRTLLINWTVKLNSLPRVFWSREESVASCIFFFLTFHFVLENSWLTNNVVAVSGEQQRDSTIHTCIHSPQTPLPSRLRFNMEQSSVCYTVGPCWLSILNRVCARPSQTP